MAKIRVPCGKSFLETDVPDASLLGVFEASPPKPKLPPNEEVKAALDAPIGSPQLETLAVGRKSAVVICSDHTRPVPSRVIMPQVLERLRRGSPGIDITLLMATGFHRATTRAELVEKFGPDIVEKEKIVVHDSRDESAMVCLGRLPSGGSLMVNRLAVETDLLLAEGFIEPHFFAGFSGGRKSVLPGVASAGTVLANHCSEFIQSPLARAGSLEGNPIHEDMLYAADKAGLAFIVNVVLGHDKSVARAFAGAHRAAHEAGCRFVSSRCVVEVPEADIVITGNGGHPLDQNIYQAVKGMTAGEAVCRDGGVIIMVSSCADGHGGGSFYGSMSGPLSPEEILRRVSRVTRDATEPDQWQFQILCRIISGRKVILVAPECDPGMVTSMRMTHAMSLNEALSKALKETGPEAKVAVIPDGVSVVVRKRKQLAERA